MRRIANIGIVTTALVGIGSLAPDARATLINIRNPGFEAPPLADGHANASAADKGDFAIGAIPGWNKGGSNSASTFVYDPAATDGAVYGTDGPGGSNDNNYLDLALPSNNTQTVNITQVLNGSTSDGFTNDAVTVQPNTIYTLTMTVGRQASNRFPGGSGTVHPDNSSFPGQFRLNANDAIPTSFSGRSGVTLVTDANTIPGAGSTSLWTVQYQTGSATDLGSLVGTNLYLQIFMQGVAAGQFQQAFIDNVALDVSPVPEPATSVALAIAATGAGLLRRRRRGRLL